MSSSSYDNVMSDKNLSEKERCELYVRSVIERVKRDIRNGIPEEDDGLFGGRKRRRPRYESVSSADDDSNQSLKLFKSKSLPTSTITRSADSGGGGDSSSNSISTIWQGLDLSKKSPKEAMNVATAASEVTNALPSMNFGGMSWKVWNHIINTQNAAALVKTVEDQVGGGAGDQLQLSIGDKSAVDLSASPDCSPLQMLADQCTTAAASNRDPVHNNAADTVDKPNEFTNPTIRRLLTTPAVIGADGSTLNLHLSDHNGTQVIIAKGADKYYTLSIPENATEGQLVTLIKGGPTGDQQYFALPTETDNEGNILLPSGITVNDNHTVANVDNIRTDVKDLDGLKLQNWSPDLTGNSQLQSTEGQQQPTIMYVPVDVATSCTQRLTTLSQDATREVHVIRRSRTSSRKRNASETSNPAVTKHMDLDKLEEIFADVIEKSANEDLEEVEEDTELFQDLAVAGGEPKMEDGAVQQEISIVTPTPMEDIAVGLPAEVEYKAMDVRKLERVIEEVIYGADNDDDSGESIKSENDSDFITLPKTVLINNSQAFSSALSEVVHAIVQPGGFIDRRADDIRASLPHTQSSNVKLRVSALSPQIAVDSANEITFKQRLIRTVVDEVLKQLEEKGLLISGAQFTS